MCVGASLRVPEISISYFIPRIRIEFRRVFETGIYCSLKDTLSRRGIRELPLGISPLIFPDGSPFFFSFSILFPIRMEFAWISYLYLFSAVTRVVYSRRYLEGRR